MMLIVYLTKLLVVCVSASKLTVQDHYDSTGSSLAEVVANYKLLQSERVIMISSEVEEVPYATKIIKALSTSVVIKKIDYDISEYDVTLVVFSSKRHFYYKLLKHVRVENEARLLIMWNWPSRTKESADKSLTDTLQDILAVMWLHQIYDVYILVEDERFDVNVYTYLPYGEKHCNEVGPPILIDTWNKSFKRFKTNKFRIDDTKYNTRRQLMKNLYGCPIKVLVKNRPPESIAFMSADNKLVLKGSGGSILASMMKKYNFTVKIKLAEDSLHSSNRDSYGLAMSTYTSRMLVREIRTGKYDFAFGVFSHLAYFTTDLDFSQFYFNEIFAFHVHCGTKRSFLSIWSDYHKEFSVSTWAFVGSVFCIIALVMKIIASVLPRENKMYISFWENVFSLWAIHIENSENNKIKTLTMRIVVTSLMFYCAIMSVAYKASLKSLLLANWEENSIKTWNELDESNLSISGVPEMYDIFSKISVGHSTLRKLRKKFNVITKNTFSDIVENVTIKRNTAYFGPESMIAFYNSIENEKKEKDKQNICQVNEIVAASPASFFLMKRGSIFQDLINQVTNNMVQTGQMQQFAVPKVVKQVSRRNLRDDQLPASTQQLKGAFLLLLAGLALAMIVFVLEIFFRKFNLERLRITRNQQHIDFIN